MVIYFLCAKNNIGIKIYPSVLFVQKQGVKQASVRFELEQKLTTGIFSFYIFM